MGGVERSETSVVMRSHPSSSHQRPLSVHAASKPTSSVAPVSNIPSRSNPAQSTSIAQRLDSLLVTPRGSNKDGTTSVSARAYSSQQHPEVQMRSKSTAALPRRPVSAVSPATSGFILNSRSMSRPTPYDGSRFREMTSTPISNQRVDVATVSPIVASSLNPIRKDVPPPDVATSAPSPIRRDVPPDPSFAAPPRRNRSYQDGNRSSSSEGASTFQRRPPTPKQGSEETDKNTQWFEYGCV